MKKYMVYGILIGAVLGYSKAEIVLDDTLPVNTQICKAKEQLNFEKGNASVGVLEGQDPCVISEEADSIKIFSLQKTTYCLPGEIITNGECTGKFGGGGGGGGQMPFGDQYKNGLSGRYGGRDSYSCVYRSNFSSSTPSSSVFSSLGACSPGGSSSGGKPNAGKSPKPDPKSRLPIRTHRLVDLLDKHPNLLAKNIGSSESITLSPGTDRTSIDSSGNTVKTYSVMIKYPIEIAGMEMDKFGVIFDITDNSGKDSMALTGTTYIQFNKPNLDMDKGSHFLFQMYPVVQFYASVSKDYKNITIEGAFPQGTSGLTVKELGELGPSRIADQIKQLLRERIISKDLKSSR